MNEADEVVGQTDRAAAHLDPSLAHRAVHFTLYDPTERRIFITQRSLAKRHDPGMWCFPGEHVMQGESYEAAVQRGLFEELGIHSSTIVERGRQTFREPTQTEVVRFYLAELPQRPVVLDRSEIEQSRWVTLTELKALEGVSSMTQAWIATVEWAQL